MIINDFQPMIWDRLLRAKSNNRIGSAYLFSGPKGCGKEWGAIEFAKLLNCENIGEISCNHCSSCAQFKNSASKPAINRSSTMESEIRSKL